LWFTSFVFQRHTDPLPTNRPACGTLQAQSSLLRREILLLDRCVSPR
jgi:hypothetical protein